MGLIPVAASIGAAEQVRGVVLNLQDLASIQRLAADERVLAFFEAEAQEVRRRDEFRLARLTEQRLDVARRLRVVGSAFAASLLAPLVALQEIGFVLAAIRLADRDAVGLDRTADEEPVADEPGVVTTIAPDGNASGSFQIHGFAFVENVLLQFLPVVVAPGEHLAHERVEVVVHGGGFCRLEAFRGDPGARQPADGQDRRKHTKTRRLRYRHRTSDEYPLALVRSIAYHPTDFPFS
jgi:hypothetical protein